MIASRTRVLIVEDQNLFRAFLADWIGARPGYELVGAARTAEEALDHWPARAPDLLLLDLQLPGADGLSLLRAARQLAPAIRALVLSSQTDPLALTRVRESGAEGFVEKDADPAVLGEALDAVASGRPWCSPAFRTVMAQENASPHAIGKILTRREQEVLKGVLDGRTSRELGENLGLSVRTIEFHRSNLMAKLGAGSLSELMAVARRRGLG